MATHKGSEGTIKVGSNAVAELLSYSLTENVDLIETTNITDAARLYTTGKTSWGGEIATSLIMANQLKASTSPELPTDEMPTDELIEHMKRRYSTRKNAKDARDPIPIKMKSNDPVGLLMFGDIHVDSPSMQLA